MGEKWGGGVGGRRTTRFNRRDLKGGKQDSQGEEKEPKKWQHCTLQCDRKKHKVQGGHPLTTGNDSHRYL